MILNQRGNAKNILHLSIMNFNLVNHVSQRSGRNRRCSNIE